MNEKSNEYFQALIANHLIQEGKWNDVSSISFDEENQSAEVYYMDGEREIYTMRGGKVKKCK